MENFYLLLGLPIDPPVKDRRKLEEALDKKSKEWNKDVNHPSKGLLYKSYVERIPQIKEQLLGDDDVARAKIIKEAEKILREQLANLLKTLSMKGWMSEADIVALQKELPQFSVERIRAEIKVPLRERNQPEFKEPKKPPESGITPTPPDKMEAFDRLLMILGKENLYQFLGCTPLSSGQALSDSAKAIFEKVRKAPKKTALLSAEEELAGQANTYFKAPGARESYNLALKNYRAEKELLEKFKWRINGKNVVRSDYLASIQDSLGIGMTQEEADYFVYNFYCNLRKCPYPTPPEGEKPLPPKQFCKSCMALSDHDSSVCQKCGTPFKVKCPSCGKENVLDKSFCACNFPIGDMPAALSLVKEAKLALAEKQWTKAEQAIHKAGVFWPGHPECESIAKQLAARQAEIKSEAERAERLKKEAEAKAHLDNIVPGENAEAIPSPKNTIALSWSAAALKNTATGTQREKITYCVVRKENAVPAGADDGVKLIETQGLSFEDTAPVAGQIYGYAIFPCYGGVPSGKGSFSKKTMTRADVSNVSVVADEGSIQLHWKNPPHAIDVICRRKKGGFPLSDSDGELVPITYRSQFFTDSNLVNGCTYGYRLIAVFQDPSGGRVCAPGVTCSGIPAERPHEVKDLRCELGTAGGKAFWAPVKKGTVKLYVSPEPFAAAGSCVAENDPVFSGKSSLKTCDSEKGEASWNTPLKGIAFLTPVSCSTGLCMIGKSVPVLPCVANLVGVRRAGDLELTWDWPQGCDDVLLVHRPDQSPEGINDSLASRVVVKKSVYDREKAYIIRQCGNQSYYFAVHAIVREKNAEHYSAPQKVISIGSNEKVLLSYSFIRKKAMVFFGKESVLLSISNERAAGIPALVLIKKNGRIPLSRQDGTVCLRIKASSEKTHQVALGPDVAEHGNYLKLFVESAENAQMYQINHPDSNSTRM